MKRMTVISVAALALTWGGSTARAQGEAEQLAQLLARVSPSICTVRIVVKAQYKSGGQSNEQESKLTIPGAAVTADGLVMVTYAPFNNARYSELARSGAPEGFSMTITPISFKVVLDGDPKEYDAFLAASDAKLDLAFVQMEGLGDKKLTPIDVASTADVALGQTVAVVSRLPKGYDFAPYFCTARACSIVTKPRRAWMLDGSISEMGLPIFAPAGQFVGVLTTVESGAKGEDDEGTMGGFFGGGYAGADANMLMVPAAAVKGVIDQAIKRVPEVAAERARKTSAPAPGAPANPAKK